MIPAEFLKKVRAIELKGRQLVKQQLTGQYLSAFRGSGMQFREFRNYVYGDDVRHISWNVSARLSEPVLKTFEEERERTLFLVVDVSASLRRGPWARQKSERLAEIAATLALSAHEAGDKLGILLYSDGVEKVIPPAKGRTHLLRIIRDVLAFEPTGVRTNPNVALRQLDRVLKKHSIVILLSDLEVFPDENVLRRTRSRHEFMAIGVEHPGEFELPKNVGFLEMRTAEAGRPVTVDLNSGGMHDYLVKHGATRRNAAQEVYRKTGVDLLLLNTKDDFIHPLQNFFKNRSGRRKG
ncbi:MAG: DUF58 domain-containing protein [Bdellovibrionales bacterium]|nr:DUF58 domain-containing protein [Bdellovibrionales bacterium]